LELFLFSRVSILGAGIYQKIPYYLFGFSLLPAPVIKETLA